MRVSQLYDRVKAYEEAVVAYLRHCKGKEVGLLQPSEARSTVTRKCVTLRNADGVLYRHRRTRKR